MNKKMEFYKKLKDNLNENGKFPSKYLFKFIVPSGGNRIQQVEDLFNFEGAVINKKMSKTGKFTSVSIHVIMKSADAVIKKYQEAEKIDSIISL